MEAVRAAEPFGQCAGDGEDKKIGVPSSGNHVVVIPFTTEVHTKNGKSFGPSITLSTIGDRQVLDRTLAHELSHTLGLRHPWDTEADGADRRDVSNTMAAGPVGNPGVVLGNLLNSEGNNKTDLRSTAGKALTEDQRKKTSNNLEKVK